MPDPRRQAERLAPQFERLQQAMERQRLLLQDNPLGLQPEKVLVLETIGSIADFVNAVRKIDGLEWLGELELDSIPPGDGFEQEKDPHRLLKGQLFLILTDQRALNELHHLFIAWQRDHETPFPRGLAPLKQAFSHLRTIRPWDAQDRVRETGLIEDWHFRLQHGQELVPFEAELWFRADPRRRQASTANLATLIKSLGGIVLQQCVVPEIAYQGVLGKIPAEQVSQILDRQEVRLLQCEDIMYVRPVGQCVAPIMEEQETSDVAGPERPRPLDSPQGDPIVALLDGLPLTGHQLLEGRLIVDDPDGFETAYGARDRVHGTAMASLICHGDLDAGGEPSKRPLYVRPILQPHKVFDGQSYEAIPENVLPTDLVHRAVRRLYEGDGDEPAVAPSVRVINLSIGDRSRPFDRAVSSWARLLDWLSWKYNVLFIVSAGNHAHDIELDTPREGLPNLSAEELEKAVVRALAADTRHRRLLSPAETLNGLTVAAVHSDASLPPTSRNLIDPFVHSDLPSPINAHGPGYRRSIKPDILLPGGRQVFSEKLGTTHQQATLQVRPSSHSPGQRVAAPGMPGETGRTWYLRGTSNAAALASRWASFLYDVITDLRSQPGTHLPVEYDTVLLKTMLVHGAHWRDLASVYEATLRTPDNSRTFRDYVGRFLGYGRAEVARVVACTDQRVTILGVGSLVDGEAEQFSLPLPPSLSARTEARRLVITLAWLTPVNSMHQNYRVAHLWFNPKNNLCPDRVCADHHSVQRGTVQHEVLEGSRALDFQDGDTLSITVNCRADAGGILEPIRYALALTLEVPEGVELPVYQEVRDRLRIRVPVRGDAV